MAEIVQVALDWRKELRPGSAAKAVERGLKDLVDTKSVLKIVVAEMPGRVNADQHPERKLGSARGGRPPKWVYCLADHIPPWQAAYELASAPA